MPKYDVVIIGSGLGGLLCGSLLSKEGYNVCILEKHHQIGGCLQTFVRNDCIFDTGLHYIGGMEKGQNLHRFFNYFKISDKLKLKKLDIDAFDVIGVSGKEYKYAQGYENFSNTLLQYFPDEKDAINKYTTKIKEICNSLDLYNLREVNPNDLFWKGIITESTSGFINSITSSNELRNVLAGINSLYAGEPEKSPLFMHALILNQLIESAWRLVDGGSQIADLLAESIEANGGTILKRCEAKKLILKNNRLFCVEMKDSDHFEAKYFISNTHPVKTLEMLDTPLIRNAYRSRINNMESTISIFSVYIVFKDKSFPYINYNYHYYKNDSVWGTVTYNEKNFPEGYILYTPASSKSDVFANCMTIITYMKYDELMKWENTVQGKRGDDYLEFKKTKAEQLLDLVERKFPDIRKHIKTYYTSTPLTYRDYTGTKEGSIYGVLKDVRKLLNSFVHPRSRIPNLLFTGQNMNMHGVFGVSIGALLTCGELVGLNYLIKKINNA